MSKNRRWAPRARCVGRSGTPWTKACQMCQESQWASATDILSQQEPWSCLLIITGYMIYWLIRGYTDHVYWLEDILIMFDHEKNHQNSSNPQKWNRKHQKKAYKYSLFCHILPPSRDVVSTENQGIRHQLSVFGKKTISPKYGLVQVLIKALLYLPWLKSTNQL